VGNFELLYVITGEVFVILRAMKQGFWKRVHP